MGALRHNHQCHAQTAISCPATSGTSLIAAIEKNFLLKFARDRRRYLRWVFEAKKHFGLSVLDYMVTSNHIHLVIKATGPNAIARSMQLIAGRTAQEYTSESRGRERFGRTVIMLPLSIPTSTCIAVSCTLI